jgi:hypothetical protein
MPRRKGFHAMTDLSRKKNAIKVKYSTMMHPAILENGKTPAD